MLQYSNGKSIDGKAAKYLTDGWVSANTKNFGKYWLEVDTTAPKISPAYYNGIKLKRATKIELRIADATTSVKQYRATIDNRWIPMEQNGKKFVYAFENTLKPGRHTFKITATDENGNTGEYAFTFMR